MAENKTETKIVMLTIKQAAALVEGLNKYNVSRLQGYHYSKPLEFDDFLEFIKNYKV